MPSTGYSLSLILAAAGITFTAVAIAAVLVIEAVLALVAAALVASAGRPARISLGIFVALALAAQVGTLLWLVRYRRE